MGYTHYWAMPTGSEISIEIWDQICDSARKLIAASPVNLAYDVDSQLPAQITRYEIVFNGTNDATGYETFSLNRDENEPRFWKTAGFCKTGGRSYDIVVCAVLAVAHHFCPDLHVSSDGHLKEWQPALDWASATLGFSVPVPVNNRK